MLVCDTRARARTHTHTHTSMHKVFLYTHTCTISVGVQKGISMFGRSTSARDSKVGARRESLLSLSKSRERSHSLNESCHKSSHPVHDVRRPRVQSVSNYCDNYSSLGGEDVEDVEDVEDSDGDVYQDSADEEEESESETQYQAACKIQVLLLTRLY